MKPFFCLLLLLACLAVFGVTGAGGGGATNAAATALPSGAPPVPDISAFSRLPVLEGGRIKPLGQLARLYLERFSGAPTFKGQAAALWLARTLFDPASATHDPVFRITSTPLRAALQLPAAPGNLYSLNSFAPALETQAPAVERLLRKEGAGRPLAVEEQALLTLYTHVLLYNQLLQSFSLVLPLPQAAPPPLFAGTRAPPTFLEAQKIETDLLARVRAFLTPELEAHPEKLTAEEEQTARFVVMLQTLRRGGEANTLLRLIPPQWAEAEWLSPWQLVLSGQGSPEGARLLDVWQTLATAWRTGDRKGWEDASATLAHMVDPALQGRLSLEEAYHRSSPFTLAACLYLLALITGWAARRGYGKRWATRSSLFLLTAAVAVHAAGVGLRMFILQRPPVGTLYESMLFVSLVGGVGALGLASLADIRTRAWAPRLIAGAAGLAAALLFLSPGVQADAETLAPLSAVLNTRFWLATHVVCITLGYGACLLTSLLAHTLLAFGKPATGMSAPPIQEGACSCPSEEPSRTREEEEEEGGGGIRALRLLALASLLLTATGTLLGGVWADQSWGRFWGWDPKENGALVIVLWLIWLLHARRTGQIGEVAWLVGLAALGVVVALAWFGVNLLNVGLHSYGFVDGVAGALAAFCLTDAFTLGALWVWRIRREALHVAH